MEQEGPVSTKTGYDGYEYVAGVRNENAQEIVAVEQVETVPTNAGETKSAEQVETVPTEIETIKAEAVPKNDETKSADQVETVTADGLEQVEPVPTTTGYELVVWQPGKTDIVGKEAEPVQQPPEPVQQPPARNKSDKPRRSRNPRRGSTETQKKGKGKGKGKAKVTPKSKPSPKGRPSPKAKAKTMRQRPQKDDVEKKLHSVIGL